MPTRRPSGTLWDADTLTANELSPLARTGWGYDNLCIFLSTNGATVITLLVPPPTDEDAPEIDDNTAYPAFYLDTELKWTFSGAGSQAILIPDFAPQYFRLKSSANGVTVTAKWVASGD